jgi:hypothetical protein
MAVLLANTRLRIGEAEFPRSPGAYVVYSSREATPPLYVGVAATQTIRQRWQGQHLRNRSGGSALRRTLGVFLGLVGSKLKAPNRYYPAEVEEAITRFLERCYVELYGTGSAAQARSLEGQLIGELDPLLNIRR